MVECHATSTRQGDVEEVQALKAFFNAGRGTVLTSFKSQIGHTLGASGVNSLIRGIMAMKAGIFPPTLNYKNPDPDMGIEGSGLTIHPEPAEWRLRNGDPRRLQVNAFGFGGSNYVVQVEGAMEQQDTILISAREQADQKMNSGESSPDGVHFFRAVIGDKPYRVSTVADSQAEAVSRIQGASSLVNGGPVAPKRLKALARQGIHLGSEDLPAPPLAFVFPGQGSHYAGMGHELYETFPVIHEWMDRAAEVADFDLLQLLFHDNEEDLQKTRWQQPALFTMEYAMVQYLVSLGIKPKALAGHSLGELTALCLAGVYSFEDGFRIVNMRAICMDKACRMHVDPGVMMAADAPLDVLEELMSRREKVYITNINSPHQLVIGGNTEAVQSMGVELKELGYRNTLLRVSMAFHSPIMECIHDELEEFIAGIEFHPPQIPVISNTTMQEFPAGSNEIKSIVMAHLESPVHWMQNARTLWNDYGIRLFVEVGPRAILSNLIADSIEEAECIQTCLPSVEPAVYRTALAQLFATGNLLARGPVRSVSFSDADKEAQSATLVPAKAAPRAVAPFNPPGSLDSIVQREIGSFIMESFGRFLRPNLLAAIRRDHDPEFSEESLESLLGQMFPGMGAHLVLPQGPAVEAVQIAAAAAPQPSRVNEAPASDSADEPDALDTTETVIRIIMEATGYERDEIEPDMDLREDLSIRSSRLPVIMDAVESHFRIKIELEDFMDVRTIKDISDRITDIVGRSHPKQSSAKGGSPSPKAQEQQSPEISEEKQSIRRVVFREVPLQAGSTQLVELSPMESVTIFSATAGTGLRKMAGDVFRRDYGVNIVPLTFIEHGKDPENEGFDLRTDGGASQAAGSLGQIEALAGMVFIVDEAPAGKELSMHEVSRLLKGFFSVLKTFLDSPAKKFVLLLHKAAEHEGPGRLLAEGLLGMFLSAAQEFGSVQFRTVRLNDKSELRDAIRASLDRSQKVIETVYLDGKHVALKGVSSPSVFEESERLELGPEDVVVFSGGGYGITSFLARSLVPFGCKLVFLGRTVLEPDIDFRGLLSEPDTMEQSIGKLVAARNPGLTDQERGREISRLSKAVEIVRTVEDLRSSGIDAAYFRCDVTDPKEVGIVVQEIVARYGKIDGIVHGAGILRDNFIKQMSPEDFAAAVDVKFLGAWNLFAAVEKSSLKFFTCLSSAASIQGNPGQSNYAAGNRMMSALMAHLYDQHSSTRFKALALPPIEGAGMAEDPEIRALMKRMKADYIHANELAGLFCRELFVAPADDVWVLFMRSLPDLSTVLLETDGAGPPDGEIEAAAVEFRHEVLPMIETISRIDMVNGELQAARSFNLEKDLWIQDHKPFKFMKHPLVSAIMAVETFMEAARVLYPHLEVRGIRDAQFLDILECPQGVTRTSEVSCRRVSAASGEVVCEVSLASREISPSGRIIERIQPNYKAFVLLQGTDRFKVDELPGFPVRLDELDSRPMDRHEAVQWYQDRTDLRGRYRVIEDLNGTSADAIRGRMIYREIRDFAEPSQTRYQYSPYLLEALMQVVNFYIVMRDSSEKRSMIPYRIGEMQFSRKCHDGEEITMEARMQDQNEAGISWNARALDNQGKVVMQAKNIMMRWFSK
jgi:malonyl CoA-acyl carrier protein transacylase